MMVVWNIRELTNTTLSDSEFCESWSICILTDRRGRTQAEVRHGVGLLQRKRHNVRGARMTVTVRPYILI